MLPKVQRAIQASIELAVIRVWREYGLSITRLGKLERIEYHALLAAYDMFQENARG